LKAVVSTNLYTVAFCISCLTHICWFLFSLSAVVGNVDNDSDTDNSVISDLESTETISVLFVVVVMITLSFIVELSSGIEDDDNDDVEEDNGVEEEDSGGDKGAAAIDDNLSSVELLLVTGGEILVSLLKPLPIVGLIRDKDDEDEDEDEGDENSMLFIPELVLGKNVIDVEDVGS
jgi:hypothetical protein